MMKKVIKDTFWKLMFNKLKNDMKIPFLHERLKIEKSRKDCS